jgi:hypothetical protein
MEIRNPANSHKGLIDKGLIDKGMGVFHQIRPRKRKA